VQDWCNEMIKIVEKLQKRIDGIQDGSEYI